MAANYTFYFTDITKTPISLQAYTSNGPLSPTNNGLLPNAVAQNTTLKLYGKGMQDYGEGIFQNFIYMLENFANNQAPVNPVEGQIWYNNASVGAELNIRGNDTWNNVMLASATSQMTGELILAGNPDELLGATPKQYVDAHIEDMVMHLSDDQNTFLNGLDLPALTATEANYLVGVTSSIQTQFNDIGTAGNNYILRAGDTMDLNANLGLNAGTLTMTGGDIVLTTGSLTSASSGGISLTSGNIILATGTISSQGLTLTAGNAVLDTGNLTLTAGGILMFGDLTSVSGDISLTSGTVAAAGVEISGAGSLTLDTGDILLTSGSINLANNINFTAGEILGLPATPSETGAASKEYVDARIEAFVAGDGKLTSVAFTTEVLGSPLPNPTDTTLEFTLTYPGSPASAILTASGVSRVGHVHDAIDLPLDNTFNASYGTNIQAGIEYVETIKANLASPTFTGTTTISTGVITGTLDITGTVTAVPPVTPFELATKGYVDANITAPILTISRTLENVIGSPETTLYTVQSHETNDNKLSIFVNGQKQYNSTRATQTILYDTKAITLNSTEYTGIDQAISYDFDISINGGSAITITIASGSNTILHYQLVDAINTQLQAGSPLIPVVYLDNDTSEMFITDESGASSTVAISYAGSGNLYLFAEDASPGAIIAATFQNGPDTITIAGDVTSSFPVGKAFAIRGTIDPTYGRYDGIYRVHSDGATFDTTNTIIPIGKISDNTIYDILILNYVPGGSPDLQPAPSAFGDVYFTPIVGFDVIDTAVAGVDGDYVETDEVGAELQVNTTTETVVFTPAITTSTIETLLYNVT